MHGRVTSRDPVDGARTCPWLGCAALASLAIGAATAEEPAAAVADVAAAPEPVYATPTTLDRAGRILAPVTVNGKGPYRFILDTGANRSVLSPRLAAELGLVPSIGSTIGVHGVTGSAVLPAVEVESVRAGDIVLARDSRVPVLSEAVLADADGILGIQGLQDSRIDVDFVADRVTIERSTGRGADFGMLTIPVSLKHGGLLMAKARIGRVRARAILDTGAERTLGNSALRDALGLTPKLKEEFAVTTVFGATPELGEGLSLVAPTIFLGDAELKHLEVTFGDLHVFRIWGLEREPAILIGMDLLGAVDRLVIDYRRREIHLKP